MNFLDLTKNIQIAQLTFVLIIIAFLLTILLSEKIERIIKSRRRNHGHS